MDPFRMELRKDNLFAQQLLQAIDAASDSAQTGKNRRRQFFLFVNRDRDHMSLRAFQSALYERRRKTKNFYPHYQQIMKVLAEGLQSMIVVDEGAHLHILGSEDVHAFDEVLSRPRQIRGLLRTFQGDDRQPQYLNLLTA